MIEQDKSLVKMQDSEMRKKQFQIFAVWSTNAQSIVNFIEAKKKDLHVKKFSLICSMFIV